MKVMNISLWIDVAIPLILVYQSWSGWRHGLIATIFSLVGVVGGIYAAAFLVPKMMEVVDTTFDLRENRHIIVIIDIVVIILVCHFFGSLFGNSLCSKMKSKSLQKVNKASGAIANGVLTLLILSVIGSLLTKKNIAEVNTTLQGSTSYRAIENIVPHQIESKAQETSQKYLGSSFAALSETLNPPINEAAPNGPATTGAVDNDKPAIVQIKGDASSCATNGNQVKTGSGFVVAPHRVMTNAHVLAGVTETTVETADGATYPATVVNFQPTKDIAVLEVPDLPATPLVTGVDAKYGENVIFAGYPGGGPYLTKAARVESVGPIMTKDIYQQNNEIISAYTLAADVRKGNSGGPVLSQDGKLLGMVFAQGVEPDTKNGYALTIDELRDTISTSATQTEPVPTGACLKDS